MLGMISGADRDRTDDLLNAIQALSQLSYGPINDRVDHIRMPGEPGFLEGIEDMDAAIDHIRTHGTQHSDAILTRSTQNASRSVKQVDSSAVYVNASTRFTDGGQFGLGAEVAVSTQKLHARGPMGLEALTTYKWVAWGDDTLRP